MSLRLALVLSAAALVASHLLFAADPRPSTISARQFAINGVSLGHDQLPALVKAFGQPLEVRPDGQGKLYLFKGVEAYAENGELLNLRCGKPACATPDGAKVGDSLDAIFRIYGKAALEERSGAERIRYWVDDTDAALLFHIRGGRVAEIELWLDYT